MPLVNIGLQQQSQAAAAGVFFLPGISDPSINKKIGDQFDRETLQPTGFPNIYTATSNDGNGTAAMVNSQDLLLTTDSSTIGDDESVRVSQLSLERRANFVDTRTNYELNIIFRTLANVSDIEFFVGVTRGNVGALSALPTTARHLGVFLDTSVSNNLFLTSANGTTQVTTDTTETIAINTDYRIQIALTGVNSALLQLFVDPSLNVQSGDTQTVTAYGVNDSKIQFFVQTEAAAAKQLIIREWAVSFA